MTNEKFKVGVLRETKTPPDRRVPLTPSHATDLLREYPNVELKIQSSDLRCFTDEEYRQSGLSVVNDIDDCDILIGVKEVHIPTLIPEKTYLFFSHTTKEQSYNRKLLQEIVKKKITLLDYEYLTDRNNIRLVAFGRWAGIVGAYNGLRAWGERFGTFYLKPAHECHDLKELLGHLGQLKLPVMKILITGGGRVAHGALETFSALNLKVVTPDEFITKSFNEPVICQIDADNYVKRIDRSGFNFQHFFNNPKLYESTFRPYIRVTDLYIPCHYWDPDSPAFMTKEDMKAGDFRMKVIADVSCDIKGPVPSTLRASTIANPFYGYDPLTCKETAAFEPSGITVIAVDNLPGELPRDASEDFGKLLLEKVFPSLFGEDREGIIERATIAENGKLTRSYAYLQDYLEGK